MARKQTFGTNLFRGLKGFATSVVAGTITLVGVWLVQYLIKQQMYGVGAILGIGLVLIYFVVWGWLAYKFWNWR